ncbi:MAG TPA: hypothetical protein VGU61_11680 [Noviherbaspirillum sp.]|jgi:hypothetical protein|uniref:hypothetical protein n=1 Tax=Noviherbaspirillum sp. TaxID=1926288 RepID=UPI002DDD4743|nr:hypothetical protein [Noviherbaspirillum sp.]HEV2610920.1 hypothetical protein [Noviherbaspirillum sp.]
MDAIQWLAADVRQHQIDVIGNDFDGALFTVPTLHQVFFRRIAELALKALFTFGVDPMLLVAEPLFGSSLADVAEAFERASM